MSILPEINNSNDFAIPFIEVDGNGCNFVCRERGEEIFRKDPYDIDELLYEVFDYITFDLATKWEVKNRNSNEDFRLQLLVNKSTC